MANLTTKIKLYANSKGVSTIDFGIGGDVEVRDNSDGNGSQIHSWSLGISQPTNSQLDSFNTAATLEESNENVRQTRKTMYGDLGEQLDEIYKNIDSWKLRIKTIKDANPKG
tara:strand:+ start:477 stop:812 length:336 start_codon:yes stop_codon:yes gene_type:complete